MKVTWGLENGTFNEKTVTTLGSYDGVHLGHRRILERLRAVKKEQHLDRSLLITFHPHPQEVLRKNDTSVELLTTIEERIALLEKEGIDEVIIIKFTKEFSQTTYLEFFHNVLVNQLGTRAMVVGFNHAFGKNREGDAEHLKKIAPEMGITIEEIAPVTKDGISISSSKIRTAIKAGDIANANEWLGYPYAFSGTVVHGDAIGAELGYPTANLSLPENKLIPCDGVYVASAEWNGKNFLVALSIGTKPTVTESGDRTIEALLIDFNGNLYGETLQIECLRYLRPQEKFSSMEALKDAIANDVDVIKSLSLQP